ncbi:MAG: hypothetical protein HYT94_03780 [Parcubacteria group bacterium]|nr:hypothetical protein [Parcubacteria group bacterium]
MMNVAKQTEASVKNFAEALEGIEITAYEIPKFYMPNWPKGVKVEGNLGRRKCRFPRVQNMNLLEWKTEAGNLHFRIDTDGSIVFEFKCSLIRIIFMDEYTDLAGMSDSSGSCKRAAAAVLFDLFKGEMFSITISKLRESAEIHNEVADKAMKAFEPFVPFAVADTLSV